MLRKSHCDSYYELINKLDKDDELRISFENLFNNTEGKNNKRETDIDIIASVIIMDSKKLKDTKVKHQQEIYELKMQYERELGIIKGKYKAAFIGCIVLSLLCYLCILLSFQIYLN